jgi:hypothetical protein
MLNLLQLLHEKLDAFQELAGSIVVQQVEIHPIVSARKERLLVIAGLNASSHTCKNKGSGVDSLQVSSRHLQDQRKCRWHHRNQT